MGIRSFGDIPDGVTVNNYLNLDMAGIIPEITLSRFISDQMELVKKLTKECAILLNG